MPLPGAEMDGPDMAGTFLRLYVPHLGQGSLPRLGTAGPEPPKSITCCLYYLLLQVALTIVPSSNLTEGFIAKISMTPGT